MLGIKPALPAIPFTTMSGFDCSIKRFIPSVPSSLVSVDGQLKKAESSSNFALFLFAESPQQVNRSG